MWTKLQAFIKDERGLETVEWAILSALIVAGIVTVIKAVGTNVNTAFGKLETATTSATAP